VNSLSLPPTPFVEGSVQQSVTVPAACLMLVALALGDPVAFAGEKSGALLHDVVPVFGAEDTQSNMGSCVLRFHTENAFHAYRPDFVLLLCLRQDPSAEVGLRVCAVSQVVPARSEHTKLALSRHEFVTSAPPSFSGGAGSADLTHPVLSWAGPDPDIRVDFAATRAVTAPATTALRKLGKTFEVAALTFRLRPGDLAVLDNRRVVHGRKNFHPWYDGRDRWLQRVYVHADLRRSRSLRPHDGYVLVTGMEAP